MTTVLESMEDQRASGNKKMGVKGTYFTTKGFVVEGRAYHVTPFNSRTSFDFTTPPGKISGVMTGYMFYLGKRSFTERHKIEDWMEVSPVHAQYYQLTIQQKQQLERQIKEGLASISQAVADLELLLHDQRKYREFLDFFEKIAKAKQMIKEGKKEEGEALLAQSEQTLKAIFIDEVDIHTDLPQTPIALRSIVSRWPTIIADFMKLKDEDTDPKKIAEKPELQVSEAEGVVLATKNKLYKKWKDVFGDTVKKRYERIVGLVNARERSVKEYKAMLQPYVHRYRSIREFGETEGTRSKLEGTAFFRHAGQAVSVEYTLTWAWRPQMPAEFAKASREGMPSEKFDIKNWRKLPIAKGFKMMIADRLQGTDSKAFLDEIKEAGLETISASPTGAEPLDDFVFDHYWKIGEHYGVNLSLIDVLKEREAFCKKGYNTFYFMSMEIGQFRGVFRMPDGSEFEDVIIEPFLMYLDTQNVILLRQLEILAKRRQEENYILGMLGEMGEEGKKTEELLKETYPHLFGKGEEEVKRYERLKEEKEKKGEKKEEKKEGKKSKTLFDTLKEALEKLGLDVAFFKPGPYETHFDDRVTGVWFPDMQGSVYNPSVTLLKAAMEVPGFKSPI